MLLNILERICIALGKTREEFFTSIYSSFMISSDLAHAVHPNIPEKHDPTNRPVMGKGPVIKINAIDIPSVDIGTPILAMHSIRELGSVDDHYSIYKTFHKFYDI